MYRRFVVVALPQEVGSTTQRALQRKTNRLRRTTLKMRLHLEASQKAFLQPFSVMMKKTWNSSSAVRIRLRKMILSMNMRQMMETSTKVCGLL
jgi:hypothetical protein